MQQWSHPTPPLHHSTGSSKEVPGRTIPWESCWEPLGDPIPQFQLQTLRTKQGANGHYFHSLCCDPGTWGSNPQSTIIMTTELNRPFGIWWNKILALRMSTWEIGSSSTVVSSHHRSHGNVSNASLHRRYIQSKQIWWHWGLRSKTKVRSFMFVHVIVSADAWKRQNNPENMR